MSWHRKLVWRVLGIILYATPAVAQAQAYVGVALGVGGADVPIGSYASGYRTAFRLHGGYELSPYLAVEAMALDLSEANDKPAGSPASTIKGVGLAVVGTLHADRWRCSGRLGVMSLEGKADATSTVRSTQPMLGLAVGFDLHAKLTLGFETSVSTVKFGAPVNDAVSINWTALSVIFRF